MSRTFTKLFSSITESTVWQESHATRLTWITMLAMADRHGRVFASIPGLANRARVTLDECRQSIQTFLAPDPDSRTPDNEGRRIEPIDGGWRLLNHAKYRDMRDEEVRREQNREAKQRQRFRERMNNGNSTADCHPRSANASAQADADTESNKEKATLNSGDPSVASWLPRQAASPERVSAAFKEISDLLPATNTAVDHVRPIRSRRKPQTMKP